MKRKLAVVSAMAISMFFFVGCETLTEAFLAPGPDGSPSPAATVAEGAREGISRTVEDGSISSGLIALGLAVVAAAAEVGRRILKKRQATK